MEKIQNIDRVKPHCVSSHGDTPRIQLIKQRYLSVSDDAVLISASFSIVLWRTYVHCAR